MSCAMTTNIGAYVLGALDATEACEVQAHVAECPSCARDLQELTALPKILGRLNPEDVAEVDAGTDSELVERALASAERRRRARRRTWTGPISAAAALVAAVVSWIAITVHAPQPQPVAVSSPPSTGSSTWSASPAVHLRPHSWGTSIDLRLPGAYPAHRCVMVVHAADGRTEVAATWLGAKAGRTDVPGATSIRLPDISTVDIVTAGGHQLARIPVHPSIN